MGTKEKFWYRDPDSAGSWLFKFPQERAGQHWAEKIAAEVAAALGVAHVTTELATIEGKAGVAVESFVPEGKELVLGNQMIERHVESYSRKAGFRYRLHTLDNIWTCFKTALVDPERIEPTKRLFADYLLLDAVIGNTDRHHENWGIVVKRVDAHWVGALAPPFDHGSSLGRELRDERRDLLMAEARVGWYVKRGRGGVHWSEGETRGPSPLVLMQRAAGQYPSTFSPGLRKLGLLDRQTLRRLVDRVPAGWMSESARTFAIELMEYSIEELRRIKT